MFRATKTYGHDLGLSCAFRQWRADSHCRYLHGYALSFRIEFSAHVLDERNWVIDFGGLKPLRDFLCHTFDHRLVVAADDPLLDEFKHAADAGVVQLTVLPNVGCEAFAEHVFDWVEGWLITQRHSPRVRVAAVECREHGANSAAVTER